MTPPLAFCGGFGISDRILSFFGRQSDNVRNNIAKRKTERLKTYKEILCENILKVKEPRTAGQT